MTNEEVDLIANQVIAGLWGDGNERVFRLRTAGFDYTEIQNRVNYLMLEYQSDLNQITREVIAGLWGQGIDRYNRLTSQGYNYFLIERSIEDKMMGRNWRNR